MLTLFELCNRNVSTSKNKDHSKSHQDGFSRGSYSSKLGMQPNYSKNCINVLSCIFQYSVITKVVTLSFKYYAIDFMSYAHVVPILSMTSYSINKSDSYGYIVVPYNVLFSLPKTLTTLKHGHKLSSLFVLLNASLLSITPLPQLYKTIKF